MKNFSLGAISESQVERRDDGSYWTPHIKNSLFVNASQNSGLCPFLYKMPSLVHNNMQIL